MKQLLLGTGLGRIALSARNAIELFSTTYYKPESLGTLVNDQLATFLVARLCMPDKGFVDVGAHIGSIISEVARCDASIGLFAVEAVPEKAAKLMKKFPKVKVYPVAAGAVEGECSFFINRKQPGYSSLDPSTVTGPASHFTEIKVPLKRLDDLLPGERKIDVIKIDVEGAELGVLRGSNITINRDRPIIMFESGPSAGDELGYTKEEMWQWFNEYAFDVLVPNRLAHNGPGLGREGFIESHFYPRRTTNYFAIPRERRVEIRDRARRVLKMDSTH
jgi:FkbM family methyltransferase